MADFDPMSAITQMIVDAKLATDHDRRAAVTVHLAILSLLVDAGICTVPDAIQRIQDTQSALPENFQTDDVTRRISLVTTKLRDYGPRPAE